MKLDSEHLSRRLEQVQQLESHLTFRLTRLSKYLEQHGQRLLQDSDMNLTTYRMLLITGIFDEITLSDLSQVMVIDGAQVSRTAKDLVAKGLLEYRAVPGNLRKKFLALTAEGQAVIDTYKPRFDARDREIETALKAAGSAELGVGIDVIANLLSKDL